MQQIDKIARAKTQLLLKHPFYAYIALSLPFEKAEGWCDTMATDMQRIYYNEDFVNNLTIDELVGVICHEVLHVAFMHGARLGNRDPKLWNIAADYAINLVVKDSGLKLPEAENLKPLLDPKYANMSAGAIYEDILKNAKQIKIKFAMKGQPGGQSQQGEGDGEGEPKNGKGEREMWGGIIEATDENGKPLSDAEMADLEAEIKIKVEQAVSHAKARGKLPGSLSGLIEAIGKPKIAWQNYLQQWIKGQRPDDYSWQKSNRRMMATHRIFMPTMMLKGAGTGVLSIDTSGSVSDKELQEYVREIAGIIDMCKPDKVFIIQHDSRISNIRELEAFDEFKDLKIFGRGGTCIAPVFDHVSKMDEEIDWFIGFSDMEIGDYPKHAPDYPVLWCSTGRDNPPFGTVLKLRDAIDEV